MRLLIVDDNVNFRRNIKDFLKSEKDIDVIGEAIDGHEAVDQAEKLLPDLILMDISMPRLNGIDATRQIKKTLPDLKIIILTLYDSDEYRKAAFSNGANGFVVKESIYDELMPVIHDSFPN